MENKQKTALITGGTSGSKTLTFTGAASGTTTVNGPGISDNGANKVSVVVGSAVNLTTANTYSGLTDVTFGPLTVTSSA